MRRVLQGIYAFWKEIATLGIERGERSLYELAAEDVATLTGHDREAQLAVLFKATSFAR